jgi:hypothetical protein
MIRLATGKVPSLRVAAVAPTGELIKRRFLRVTGERKKQA